MGTPQEHTVDLLRRMAAGDSEAAERLYPHVESQLHVAARRLMAGERMNHTLQPTALIDDVFVKLVGDQVVASSRAHFVELAARVMRRILVDHARGRGARKRGGDAARVSLTGVSRLIEESSVDVLALEDALTELGGKDERKAKVVELRFYGGMTTNEVATVLGVSPKTAEADWYMARAWLRRALSA